MFYVKHKEIIRVFDFCESINKENLPGYIKHYILDDEIILASFKTSNDHGIFTDTKIVLFDNYAKRGIRKEISMIPYKTITAISLVFEKEQAEINLLLNNYPLKLKFTKLEPEDKIRLRILYTCLNRIICGQKPIEKDIQKLLKNDFKKEMAEILKKIKQEENDNQY